jgi:hypothetical protein
MSPHVCPGRNRLRLLFLSVLDGAVTALRRIFPRGGLHFAQVLWMPVAFFFCWAGAVAAGASACGGSAAAKEGSKMSAVDFAALAAAADPLNFTVSG